MRDRAAKYAMTQAPPPSTPLRFGTRQSPLALAQANEAKARLREAHGWPDEAVELVPVISTGDRIQDRPLAEIGGKALWTRELDRWLIDGRIDAAVHSMKDVETIRPEALAIGALLPRADRTDRLLGAASIDAIPHSAIVGTSAPRRAAQILHRRGDLTVVPIRGNVATRMAKLAAGEVQATFLASAGLIRLGRDEVGTTLPAEQWLPAPAQGAIGLECRADDAATRDLLKAIDHAETRAEVETERSCLEALGGTCHSPVAVWCRCEGERMQVTLALFSEDGRHRVEATSALNPGDTRAVHEFASALLRSAPGEIRALFDPV